MSEFKYLGLMINRANNSPIAMLDHIIKKADGGLAIDENGQLAHPYCNSARDAIIASGA